MIRAFALIAATLCTFMLLTGFTIQTVTDSQSYLSQPPDERATQELLPIATDSLWTTLAKTKVNVINDGQHFTADFPKDVIQLNGTIITISGFILPLQSTENFSHFLLSKRTPTCFFCPPGEPDEIIEVYSDKPTQWDDNLVKYQGKMTIHRKSDEGLFFTLRNAKSVK